MLSLAGPQPMLLSTPFWGASTPPGDDPSGQRPERRCGRCCCWSTAPEFRLERLTGGDAVLALLTTEKLAVERVEQRCCLVGDRPAVGGCHADLPPLLRLDG